MQMLKLLVIFHKSLRPVHAGEMCVVVLSSCLTGCPTEGALVSTSTQSGEEQLMGFERQLPDGLLKVVLSDWELVILN